MTPPAIVNPFLHLQRHADENPQGVFSRTADTVVTYAEAVVSAKRLAYELRRLGVQPGHVVALDLPDRLGIVFTEAVYHEAAVSTVLPEGYPLDAAVTPDWVFTTRPAVHEGRAQVVEVDARFLQLVEQNPYGIEPRPEPIDTLRIVFSSGTTGTPKAIALGGAMEAIMDMALPMWFAAGPNLSLMDVGTPVGIGEFFLSVKAGHPFLCAGNATQQEIVRLASDGRVGSLRGSPAQVAALVGELEAQGRTLPDVRVAVVSGTVLPVGLAERLLRATEGCMIITNYGSTEAGGATVRRDGFTDPFDAGHVSPGSVVEIVDENDVPVADGVEGRVRHRAPGMATGYLNDLEATARFFTDGWFYPGDRGFFRPDGGLTLSGRESELLNAGGVKVDPLRIDQVALAWDGVIDACSFEYLDRSDVARVGLVLVTEDVIDIEGLVAALTAAFSTAAPSLVARVEQVPRTVTGKPLRRVLADRYRETA